MAAKASVKLHLFAEAAGASAEGFWQKPSTPSIDKLPFPKALTNGSLLAKVLTNITDKRDIF